MTLAEGATATVHVFTVEEAGPAVAAQSVEGAEDGIASKPLEEEEFPGSKTVVNVDQEDVEISFEDLFGDEVSNAMTDSNGMTTGEGLIPGEHEAIADPPEGSMFAPKKESAIFIEEDNQDVWEFELPQGGSVMGTVRSDCGGENKPFTQLHISLIPIVGEIAQQFIGQPMVDNEGNFQEDGLAPGMYEVNAFAFGAGSGISPTPEVMPDKIFEVMEDMTTNLEFCFEFGGTAKGTVTYESTGDPAEGVRVVAKDADTGEDFGLGGNTDGIGAFEVDGIPVDRNFVVVMENRNDDPEPEEKCVDSFAVDETRTNSLPVESFRPTFPTEANRYVISGAGEVVEGIKILTKPGGSVSGQVISDRDQKPIRSVQVRAWVAPSFEETLKQTFSDIDGNWYLDGLDPDKEVVIQLSTDTFTDKWSGDVDFDGDIPPANVEPVTPGSGIDLDFALSGGAGPEVSDLSITKMTLTPDVELGEQTIIYDIFVENRGPHLLNVGNAADILQEETEDSIPVSVPIDQIIFIDIERLGVKERIPITLEVVPIKDGVLMNQATVINMTGVDPDLNNNQAFVPVVVSAPVDSDGNGIPDYWAQLNNLVEPVDPDGDPDGDLRTNAQEYTYGTDPNVHNIDQLFDAIHRPNLVTTKLSFKSEVGRIYTLQRASNLELGNWATIDKVGGNGNTIMFSIPSLGDKEFYRLIVTVP